MAGQAVDKLVSRNGKFALGFFASGSSTATSKSSSSADTATTTPNCNDTIADVAVLNNNGNLVIRHASGPSQQMWWQSFDYPTEVSLPGSKLGRNKVTGLNRVFVSKKNRINPGRGSYCVGVDSSFDQGIKLSLCSSSLVYWASGTFSQQYVDPSDTGLISYNHVDNNQEQYYIYSTPNDEALSIYATVEISGQIKARVWNESLQRWQQFYTQPMDPCSVQAACGPFTICTNNNTNLLCDCMKGFSFKSPGEWDLDNPAGGCMRNNPLDCTADKFLPVPGVTLAYNPLTMQVVAGASGCAQSCANDCSCTAYSYTSSASRCSIWHGELLNTATSTTAGEILYVRLAAKDYFDILRENKRGPSIGVVTAASTAGAGTIMVLIIMFIIWRRNHGYNLPSSNTQDCIGIRTFRYSYLRYATKKFSERLGGGGFGSVYKGLLSDSAINIAVKRLDGARQGEKQFRAEVSSIGLIQHINLVKLIGFCCESDKRLLVYEHMSNGSLDVHLFNNNDIVLDWSIRYQIAKGVARGLSYLHEGCRECIIHCDIKPENILLDTSFAPKVADFGLATIVGRDFSRVLTTFRGTVGYLAPEWISGEPITQKVDVYSFGMVLLEIVSGRRNSSKVYTSDSYDTSFFHVQAISMLHGGDVNSLVDPRLHGEFNLEEAIRVCKVAFWCIQDHEYDRPTMGEVVRVLEGLQELDMPPMPRQLAAITKC
ncbi:putative S-locus receptor-like protein kinase family protein [Hordeum vulgare]|nr:putative S-locus receptor-like protein kinase family protein [Hordeum vulgare]